jgi:DNA-directed RNA polymerase subunit F
MPTLKTIIKELQDVPLNRLDELYSIIHSFKEDKRRSASKQKEILSFAGSFKAMTPQEYDDFINELRKTRNDLFNRADNGLPD